MQIDSFLGIRNTSPARSIPNNALVDAVDVDIDDAGIIVQRPGFILSKSLSITAAYSTLDDTGYVVSGGNLYRVQDDLSLIELVASSATSFCDYQQVLFTNDGLRVEDDAVVNIKLPQPELPPDLSVISGELPTGTYNACYCYRSATGLESGSSPIASIELTEAGGIAIAPITAPSGYTATVYMTDANGSVYYDNAGVQLNPVQVLAESFPDDVEHPAYHDAKLFLSRTLINGNTQIVFSKTFHPHLYALAKDYIIVQGQVLAMHAIPQALIIGTASHIYADADGALAVRAD